jgi:hypothetical protein
VLSLILFAPPNRVLPEHPQQGDPALIPHSPDEAAILSAFAAVLR